MSAEDEKAQAVADEKMQEEKPNTTKKAEGASRKRRSEVTADDAALVSGPRQRKKADHFSVEIKEKAEFVIKPVSWSCRASKWRNTTRSSQRAPF